MKWISSDNRKPKLLGSYFVYVDGAKDVMRLESILKYCERHPNNKILWLDESEPQKKSGKIKNNQTPAPKSVFSSPVPFSDR